MSKNFTDSRDGTVYPCVLMPDGKWWSAENLAWDGAGLDYDNNPANRTAYGRLYSLVEVTAGVLPVGTHLPSYADWLAMHSAAGDSILGAKDATVGWTTYNGDNSLGFYLRGSGWGQFRYGAQSFYNLRELFYTWANHPDYAEFYVYVYADGVAIHGANYHSTNAVDSYGLRFIVDSGNIPDPELADGITFTPRTIETPFRTESRNLRRFFVQGAPVFESELKFDVDHSEIEAMDSWIESVGLGTFSRSAFAIGNADTIFQVLEPPTRSFSHKGMTVSMSVTATQDTPAYLPYPINEGVLPVCCPFPLSGQGSLGSEAAQLTEATGGRSTAKAFTASRGDRLSFTYATDKDGLAHFISWWSAILKCGHRGFFASMPGRTCWYFEFTEQPTFSLQSDLGKVTIKIQGRPTTKEIAVTGGSTTISKTGSMNLTTNFSGTQRVVLVDTKNRLVDYALYSSGGFDNDLQLDLFGVPVGEYRWVIVSTMGMSRWFDMKVVN